MDLIRLVLQGVKRKESCKKFEITHTRKFQASQVTQLHTDLNNYCMATESNRYHFENTNFTNFDV